MKYSIISIIGLIFLTVVTSAYASSNTESDAKNQEKDVENQDEPIVEGKETIKTNDTDIHITCTSNIPDLVSC